MKYKPKMGVYLKDSKTLADFMKWRRLTVRKLARLTGVSHSTIGHLRSGRRKYCNPQLARQISEVLDVPPEALFLTKVFNVPDYSRQPQEKKAA